MEVTQHAPGSGNTRSADLSVGDGIQATSAAWSFGGEVPKHFEAHVSKSVPGYAEGHDIIAATSDYFVKADSVCYELGCSTGALARKLASRHPKSVRWIGIDVEPDMVRQAEETLLAKHPMLTNVQFVADDILSFEFEPTDFVVAYYTVQFIHPRVRQELFSRIYKALNWGGAFMLFEKVRGPDARFQDIATGIYTDYKLAQGYSASEIVGKSQSLKGVLEPFSSSANIDMCQRAGFADVMTIFKHVCFEGFFCIK